jgi:hypothetical protein
MAYQEIKTESYGRRVGGSFKGMLFAIVLCIAGTYLLWWNEGRTVRSGDTIAEARLAAVEMADISKADSSFSGKLVHATGRADTKDVLKDAVFGIETNAIRLERSVEYYQWVEKSKSEEKEKLGGGKETITTYYYEKEWANNPVNSEKFKDPDSHRRNKNFVVSEIKEERIYASNVTFGVYRLPDFIRDSIVGASPVDVKIPQIEKEALNRQIAASLQANGTGGDLIYNILANQLTGTDDGFVHVNGGTVYLGANPSNPAIGDTRVSFSHVLPAEISILAVVRNDTFEQFAASNGNKFSKISMGSVSAESMFGAAEKSNAMMAWILRVVGIIIVGGGIRTFLAPLAVLGSVVPVLGHILGAGAGFVAFLIGTAWSLVVIAIAWLRFRPLIGGGMLAAAAVIFVLLFIKGHGRRAAS